MSLTHPVFGALTTKRRASRLPFTAIPCWESVVQRKRRCARARNPAARISRATRLRAIRRPRSRNSAWTRGLP
jgi:hypothetical protein